jgi:hypothetical protein
MNANNEVEETESFNRSRLPKIGIICTSLWIGVAIIYVAMIWPIFVNQEPADFATFLSGIFAPVAFFWLVLGFFQQGQELSYSSKALYLQQKELVNSVKQQTIIARIAADQLSFEKLRLEYEQKEKHRISQPVLLFESIGDFRSESSSRNFDFYMINKGQPCSKIEVSTNPNVCAVKRPQLFYEEKMYFGFAFAENSDIEPVSVTIQYVDSQKIAQTRQFDFPLVIYGDKKFIGPPVEDTETPKSIREILAKN